MFYLKKKFGKLSPQAKKKIVLGIIFINIWLRSLKSWIEKCNIHIHEKDLNILNLNIKFNFIKLNMNLDIEKLLINWDDDIYYFLININLPQEHALNFLYVKLQSSYSSGVFESLKTILEFDLTKITDILMAERVKTLPNYENGLLEFYINHFNIHLDFINYYVDLINFQILQRQIWKQGTPYEKVVDLNFRNKAVYIKQLQRIMYWFNLNQSSKFNPKIFLIKEKTDLIKFEKELNDLFHLFFSEIKRLKTLNLNLLKENNELQIKLKDFINNLNKIKKDEKIIVLHNLFSRKKKKMSFSQNQSKFDEILKKLIKC
jgi:hypothetical protein